MNRSILTGAAMALALVTAPSLLGAQAHTAHGADSAKAHAMPCAMHASAASATDSPAARMHAGHMTDMKATHGAGSAAHAAHMPGMKATHGAGAAQAASDTTMHAAMKAKTAEHGTAHDCAACCKAHAEKKAAAAMPGHKP